MNLQQTPVVTEQTFRDMEDMSWFTHALIFDNLLIVSQKETNCFVLNTARGLAVIDAIWPSRDAFEAIVSAVQNVGWDPDFRHLLLTHGHADHTGCGKYFVEAYGVETYLSKTDDQFWTQCPIKPDKPETWKDFEISHYVTDGDVLDFGDILVHVCATPGHTPGGLSYLFPVRDNGTVHMAALWGGTTPPRDAAGIVQYLRSLDKFQAEAERFGVDVALSNHTAVDNGLERIAYSRKRMAYMPNIYIIGQAGFRQYCQVFRTMSYDRLDTIVKASKEVPHEKMV